MRSAPSTNSSAVFPLASSITHLHLLAALHSEIRLSTSSRIGQAPISLLDAGCGSGAFLEYVLLALDRLIPERHVNGFGFDVGDHGVQHTGFLENARSRLSASMPAIDWSTQLRLVKSGAPWPFDTESMDFVVSNQVLEHVHDPASFFLEAFRVLKPGGCMINLFPLSHYVYEGHLHLPFVHRIDSHDLRQGYIRMMSRLGQGKYPGHAREFNESLETFSERHADYMAFWTHYLSESEVLEFARKAGLRASMRYTDNFYVQKLRSLLRLQPLYSYKSEGRGLRDSLGVKFLRYISCVTLTCHKRNSY